jgi:hypothetical protein
MLFMVLSGGTEEIQDKRQSEQSVSAQIRTRHFSNRSDEVNVRFSGYVTSGAWIGAVGLQQ